MANYKNLFMQYLDEQDVKYTDQAEHVVKILYSGDNMQSIPIYVFFDSDGDPLVQFKCWDILNFKDKDAAALIACNNLNNEWRWVKFSLDKDSDIVASIDAYIDVNSCGEECLSLVRRIVNIVDEAYPTLARALWA